MTPSTKAMIGEAARRAMAAGDLMLLRFRQPPLDTGEDGGPMPIVLIHLGSRFPRHMRACISQVERIEGRRPLIVGHARAARYRGDAVARFRGIETLSGLGGRRFWRYACERFFVLEEFMAQCGIDRCMHIESDVLLYRASHQLADWLGDTYGSDVAVCPMTDTEDTAAVMYVGSRDALARFNAALLALVTLGPAALLARYGGSMAHEMRMLHILRTEEGLCRPLPTTIEQGLAAGAPCLFDPASYGQWVDGGPGQPGVPYAGEHHAIGREFLSGNYELLWDAQVSQPTVRAASARLREWPLANLHLHSKRLYLFCAHAAGDSQS